MCKERAVGVELWALKHACSNPVPANSERGPLQVQLRLSRCDRAGFRVGLCPYTRKEGETGHRDMGWRPRDDGGRDRSDGFTSRRLLSVTEAPEAKGRVWKGFSLRAKRGVWPPSASDTRRPRPDSFHTPRAEPL